MNRQDACSTRKFTFCGTGILPVLENGARCEFEPRLIVAQFKIIKKTGFKSVTPRLRTSEFQRWYKPPHLSVESIPNRFSKILKPPHLSVGSI
jgi:hypothetical protein